MVTPLLINHSCGLEYDDHIEKLGRIQSDRAGVGFVARRSPKLAS